MTVVRRLATNVRISYNSENAGTLYVSVALVNQNYNYVNLF